MGLRQHLKGVLVLLVATLALVACAPAPLLGPLEVSGAVVRPNGLGVDAAVRVLYTLSSRADIAVDLVRPDGSATPLRERATRAPDTYELRFDGTVPTEIGRRVLPSGDYTIRIRADNGTRTEELARTVTVVDADMVPVEIQGLQVDKPTFSPNGDGQDDDLRITYRLTKEGEASVYVTGEDGRYYAIDPWQKRRATFQSHLWDGTTGGRVFGGKLLPDGPYTVHVEARDIAGNVARSSIPVAIADGGTPRLEITDVRFTPISVILGGVIDVRITVRNAGSAPLRSWGPPPGHLYDAPNESYASIRDPADPSKAAFFERQGVWRVGITWQNAPRPYPLRWGLFPPTRKSDGSLDWDSRVLKPGESVTVDGQVRANVKEDSRQVRFSAGVVQEGVGFPGGPVGEQLVQVGW